MKTDTISELFEGGGIVIHKSKNESIFDLLYKEVVALFEMHGVILFRDFELDANILTQFTDLYTEKYSGDANRREKRFNNKNIRNVDYGLEEALLHSESSFAPSFPEIIWFFCNTPATVGGETILCDGLKLWNMLSSKIKQFFLSEQIHYEIKIPVIRKQNKKVKKPWLLPIIGSGYGFINYRDGCLYTVQKRYAVHEARIGGRYVFANHLMSINAEPQIISGTLSDGSEIPDYIYNEIKDLSDQFTFEHVWQKNDLIMVDNKRFMHGRRLIVEDDPRDIVIVQSQRASFGYGSTTRKTLNDIS